MLAFFRNFSNGLYTTSQWGDNFGQTGEASTMDLTVISAQLEKYENKWVAIDESEERVVGVGDNAFEATKDAERSGYPDTILFKVPSFDSALIPLA